MSPDGTRLLALRMQDHPYRLVPLIVPPAYPAQYPHELQLHRYKSGQHSRIYRRLFSPTQLCPIPTIKTHVPEDS